MSTVKVEYVGLKERETDCVAGTGLVWEGLGSVHDVPLKAWETMARHPDVWKLAEDQGTAPKLGLSDATPPATTAATAPDLAAMDDAALIEFAKVNNIKVHHKQHDDALRAVIAKALDALKA